MKDCQDGLENYVYLTFNFNIEFNDKALTVQNIITITYINILIIYKRTEGYENIK
jgi:hypothetical protein